MSRSGNIKLIISTKVLLRVRTNGRLRVWHLQMRAEGQAFPKAQHSTAQHRDYPAISTPLAKSGETFFPTFSSMFDIPSSELAKRACAIRLQEELLAATCYLPRDYAFRRTWQDDVLIIAI